MHVLSQTIEGIYDGNSLKSDITFTSGVDLVCVP